MSQVYDHDSIAVPSCRSRSPSPHRSVAVVRKRCQNVEYTTPSENDDKAASPRKRTKTNNKQSIQLKEELQNEASMNCVPHICERKKSLHGDKIVETASEELVQSLVQRITNLEKQNFEREEGSRHLGQCSCANYAFEMKSANGVLTDVDVLTRKVGKNTADLDKVVKELCGIVAEVQTLQKTINTIQKAVDDLKERGSEQFKQFIHNVGGLRDYLQRAEELKHRHHTEELALFDESSISITYD